LIWETLFKEDPLNRTTGTRLREELLRHGGAKPPYEILQGLLGRPPSEKSFLKEIGADVPNTQP
jgi:intermediate peptidase